MALRASIGQYYSVDSPVHRLDPRVKLVSVLAFMVSCFFVDSPSTLLLAGLAIGLAVAFARVPARRLLSQIRPIALFLVITSVVNLFFVQTGDIALAMGPLCIHWGGVEAAVLYTARFFLLLVAGSLLTLTTTPVALADAAERLLSPLERLGVPVGQGALVLSIALRFVPTLLVLDEPMAGLDPRGRARVRELIRALKRAGTTLLMVTHSMEDVAELADQVVALECGRRVDPSLALDSREVGGHGAAR